MRKVDARYDTVRNSVPSVENSISALKNRVDKVSKACQTKNQALESKKSQLQICKSVTEVNRDIKAAKETITGIEKSLTVLTKQEEFIKPTKTMKPKVPAADSSFSLISNMYAGLLVEYDEEITFRNVESNEQNPIIITEEANEQPQMNEAVEGQPVEASSQNNGSSMTQRDIATAKESTNETQHNNGNTVTARDHTESDIQPSDNRRNKVYLIGDSISGQVNAAALGKSTRTFVQKMKAPKIQDISKVTNQVKNVKLIVVHTGINKIQAKSYR